jgi:hypothetical protein
MLYRQNQVRTADLLGRLLRGTMELPRYLAKLSYEKQVVWQQQTHDSVVNYIEANYKYTKIILARRNHQSPHLHH